MSGVLVSRAVRAACIVGLFLASAVAQTFSSTIAGTVTDPSGAAVAGASVSLTNLATGEVRNTTTEGAGRYTFARLLPSDYSLKITHPGFQEYLQPNIKLTTNQSVEVSPHLSLGSVSQTMEVTAGAEMVDAQTANRSMTLTTQVVQELPLNVRNALSLVHSSAGVVAARTGVSNATQDQNTNRFSLNGGRHESTAVLIDGIPMGAGDWGGLIASPGTDAVRDVQVVRNTYDTEFGRTGGGVINITTRGGGAQYHGGVFDFLRNDNLDANTFFNNRAGKPLAEYKRNQFGGTFGGPIWNRKSCLASSAMKGCAPARRRAVNPLFPRRFS